MSGKKGSWFLLKRLFQFIKPYRSYFILALSGVLLLSFLSPLRPFLIGKTVDHFIIKQQNTTALGKSLLGILGLLVIETLIIWLSSYYSNLMAQSIIRDIRNKVFRKILHFKTTYFDQTPVGALVTRIVSDVEAISEVFSAGLMEIFGDMLSLFAILAFMFATDWKLSLLTLVPIPILIFATRLFARAMKKSFQMERTQVSKLNTFVQEHLMGMGLIQLFGREKPSFEEFTEINKKHRDAHISAVWANSIFFPVVELLSSLSIAFLLVWGALLVEGKTQTQIEMLYGNIISFTLWINQLYRPIRQLADKFNILQRGTVRAERIFDILDDDENLEVDKGEQTDFVNGDIAFKNVSFSYVSDSMLFSDFNLYVEKGKTTAFVGATGSGKTTIINLIGRFYEINGGEISIAGIDIRKFSRDVLSRSIGFVLQDVYLFSDTIHNNITLGNPEISREQVRKAAKMVGADGFIMEVPGNYDHIIGERGGVLSVGQRQLVSFVRAMVYDPQILILDEATSSVDSESETMIQNAISELTKNRTSIIIAHRLSTVQQADKIIVLDHGKIAEEGTHKVLIENGGVYQTLFEKQFNITPNEAI